MIGAVGVVLCEREATADGRSSIVGRKLSGGMIQGRPIEFLLAERNRCTVIFFLARSSVSY